MRQKPTTQGAAFEALKASARASEKLAEAVGNSINKSHSVTSKAPESLIRFIQEYPLDDRADFGVQVEEMLRSMYDIYAPLIILGSSSYTGAEFRVTPGNSFLGRRTPPFDKGNLKLLFPL